MGQLGTLRLRKPAQRLEPASLRFHHLCVELLQQRLEVVVPRHVPAQAVDRQGGNAMTHRLLRPARQRRTRLLNDPVLRLDHHCHELQVGRHRRDTLGQLTQATPSARPPVGPVAVPSATDHLKAAELVLPYLLRLAVLTGLQTGAECKLSFDLQRAMLQLLGASPAGVSLLETLETRSSLVTADLVLEVLSSLGASP